MPFVDAEAERALPRALAPWLLTVIHHAHWGVDLFFVLSGFSLAMGYLRAFDRGGPSPPGGGQSALGEGPSPAPFREKRRGTEQARDLHVGHFGHHPPPARAFLVRRAARILPGFYVAVLITLAFHRWTFAMPGFWKAALAHALLLQGYVTPGGIVIIGAAWSLTTEAHFYLLLPLIARPLLDRARGSRRFWIGAALVIAAWVSRGALHAIVLEPGVRTDLLEATQRRWITSRLDEFVLGALAAAAHAEILRAGLHARAARFAPVGLALAAALLVIGFRLEGELYLEPRGSWPYAVVSLATAALVLAAALCEGRTLRLVAPGPLCAVGVVSYGFFLYHQLAIGLIGSVLRAPGWRSLGANAAGALALSLAAGAASWVLVERPAMRWASAQR